MSDTSSLTRAERRTLIAGSILRTLSGLVVIAVGLVALPDALHLTEPWQALLLLTAGIGIWLLYLRRAVRQIGKARFPRVRSAETLVVSAALFIGVFSSIYVMISAADPSAFTEELDHFSGAYFAMTVLATVGFGDITPVTNLARGVAMVQMALDLVIVGVAFRVLGGAADRALKERSA